MTDISAHTKNERVKKTMMFDRYTREKLYSLVEILDMNQTDVLRRAVNVMHHLYFERAAGKTVQIVEANGSLLPVNLDFKDSCAEETKITLKFSPKLLELAEELCDAYDTYLTYIFRRAVYLLHELVFAPVGSKIVVKDHISGESEAIRFF